jgi:hypothetical protein
MNPLPHLQKLISPLEHLCDQAAHIGPLDADAEHHFGRAARAEQVDFRLSGPGDVDVRRFMIECVNDEPEAVSAVNDNQCPI